MSQPVTYTGVVAMAPGRGIGYRGVSVSYTHLTLPTT